MRGASWALGRLTTHTIQHDLTVPAQPVAGGNLLSIPGLGDCLSEKMAFEQRPEEEEDVSMKFLEESVPGRGSSSGAQRHRCAAV